MCSVLNNPYIALLCDVRLMPAILGHGTPLVAGVGAGMCWCVGAARRAAGAGLGVVAGAALWSPGRAQPPLPNS